MPTGPAAWTGRYWTMAFALPACSRVAALSAAWRALAGASEPTVYLAAMPRNSLRPREAHFTRCARKVVCADLNRVDVACPARAQPLG